MTPNRLLQTAILPALNELATLGIRTDVKAARFLLAIALQESALLHRRQVSASGVENGPASSFWQFERLGGCKGVLTHRAASKPMLTICEAFNVGVNPDALWEAMRYNDIVAAAAARLLVYTLPGSLPTTADDGWKQYLSAWRPGKPHPERWADCWHIATETTGI